ncbi:MAG: hypothetical protein NT121_24055 [Chloroflexi bacterium]|nr:hypothetical protein [Chloroflexota bacterium]
MQLKTEQAESIEISKSGPAGTSLPWSAARVQPFLSEVVLSRLILALSMAAGSFLRIWQINAMGSGASLVVPIRALINLSDSIQ